MISNFTKLAAIIYKPGHLIFGWFITRQKNSRKAVAVNQQYKGSQAGGMFGLLVSNDDAHRH